MTDKVLFRSISLLVLLILISCSNSSVFDRVVTIPSDGWQAKNCLLFDFPISDTTLRYDVFFHVRNKQNYTYSNLWLFVDIKAPNGFIKRDTFEIMLADATGRWYGKGIGNINSMLVPYKTEFSFPLRGLYEISIQHAMYDETLENLMDVGIRIQPHQ
jgi:gliding motility-associated lipoprotein GldH